MNILIGAFTQETNPFVPIPTNLEVFKLRGLYFDEEIFEKCENTKTELGGFIEVLKKSHVNIIPSVANNVIIGGRIEKKTCEYVKGELIKRIKEASNLDGILLCLHGSMLSEDSDDTEGDLLEEIRDIVGKNVYIVSTVDMHGTITKKMVSNADVILGYDTVPHTDMFEVGKRASEILISLIENKQKIYTEFIKIPVLINGNIFLTTKEPIISLMNKVKEARLKKGIINATMVASWSLMDIKEAGATVIVTALDKNIASEVASSLAKEIWDLREIFVSTDYLVTIEEALKKSSKISGGPIVFADVADNPLSGAFGDSTHILKAIIENSTKNVAFGTIRDEKAVEKAIKTGVGNEITLDLGAKYDKISSSSIKVNGVIKLISDGKYINKGDVWHGVQSSMGKTFVLKLKNDVDVVVSEASAYAFDPEIFRSVGIEPFEKKIIVLKSGAHFKAAYEPVAKGIFMIDCPGLSDVKYSRVKYTNVTRPIYPLDLDMEFII